MNIDNKLVQQAKEQLGDENAALIAEILEIPDYDERAMKCCCPFHNEDTPSFIFDHKKQRFHCFGCGKTVDVIDAYMAKGKTYAEAVQELFSLTDIKYSFGMRGVKEFASEYRYPRDEENEPSDAVVAYWASRKISKATLDYCGIRQDAHGNTAFRYFDTNDVLTLVKYRPSRPVQHGENKSWCQKDADTKPLLWNMNKINMSEALLVTEGEVDTMSAIEAGYANAVSVPFGANSMLWIDENWEWLDQFDSIIICGDNDKPGAALNREASHRLGLWRTKIVELPTEWVDPDSGKTYKIKDINDLLRTAGKTAVMNAIVQAKSSPIDSVTDVSMVEDVEINDLDGLYMGIKPIDRELSRAFLYGSFTILTGVNGCVDCDTEFLTKSGWKRMDEYEQGDEVLVYDENGQVHFELPDEYIKEPCDQMLSFRSPGVSQCVTPEHTMVFVNEQGLLDKMPAAEVAERHNTSKLGFQGHFINIFEYDYPSSPHNFTVAQWRAQTMAIMLGTFRIQNSDGRERLRCTLYTVTKKDAKYITKLLDDAKCSYKQTPSVGRRYMISFIPPKATTTFNDAFWRVSVSQAKTILKEIRHWRFREIGWQHVYCSPSRYEAGYVQFLLTMLEKPTRLMEYQAWNEKGEPMIEYRLVPIEGVTANQIDRFRMVEKCKPVDGFKYCFTTSTGMFVTRRDGLINVTGNSGKSSFLNQLICQCLEQGKDAWLYSMELPNFLAKAWMQYVMAGPHHVISKHDVRGKTNYSVPPQVKKQIDNYWQGRVYLYKDGYKNTIGDIMETMEESARRFGCKLFIIDNLTAMNIEANENNKLEKQNETVTKLIDFAKKYDVAVILVIHPRKLEQVRRMTKFDVQGSGGMVDLAHRAFSLYRVTPKDRQGVPNYRGEGWKVPPIKHDVLLDVLKDRFTGMENAEYGLFYDKASMRFFTDKEELNHTYPWDKNPVPEDKWIWYDRCNEDEMPF